MVVIFALPLALSSGEALADTFVLKDGRSLEAQNFRREGDSIVSIAEVPGPGGKPMKVERSIALAEIAKVETLPPPVLRDAVPRLAVGDAAAVLPAIVAAAKAGEPAGNIPGSFWPDLLILQAHTLIALGRYAEAETLAAQLKGHADETVVAGGNAISALIASHKEPTMAMVSIEELTKVRNSDETKPSTIAAASVACGLVQLAKKEPRLALRCFLELPVFLPDETALSAIAGLGAAQSFFDLSDYDRAITTLEELIQRQPGTPETAKAKAFLPVWKLRRTHFNESK